MLSRSVKGSVALITGAGSGMGHATAEVFAAEGAHVAVTDFNEQARESRLWQIASRPDKTAA